MVRLPDGLSVTVADGERWTLALALLDAGEAPVYLDGIQFQRSSHPTGDQQVHAAVIGSPSDDRAVAQERVAAARSFVGTLLSHDEPFRRLVERYGIVWEYVNDDAAVLLATADDDGTLIWPPR